MYCFILQLYPQHLNNLVAGHWQVLRWCNLCPEFCTHGVSREGERVFQTVCLPFPELCWQSCLIASETPPKLTTYIPISCSLEPSIKPGRQEGSWDTAGKQECGHRPHGPPFRDWSLCCSAHPLRTPVGPQRAWQNWVFHHTHPQPLQTWPQVGCRISEADCLHFRVKRCCVRLSMCTCVYRALLPTACLLPM